MKVTSSPTTASVGGSTNDAASAWLVPGAGSQRKAPHAGSVELWQSRGGTVVRGTADVAGRPAAVDGVTSVVSAATTVVAVVTVDDGGVVVVSRASVVEDSASAATVSWSSPSSGSSASAGTASATSPRAPTTALRR